MEPLSPDAHTALTDMGCPPSAQIDPISALEWIEAHRRYLWERRASIRGEAGRYWAAKPEWGEDFTLTAPSPSALIVAIREHWRSRLGREALR